VSPRTVRHWLQRFRRAETLHGDGYRGLLPRFQSCGNRNRKLPEKTQALMSDIIAGDYETLKQKRKFHVYGALVRSCESEGTVAPSYKTFSVAVDRRLQGDLVLKRCGRRAAYQLAPPYLELHLTRDAFVNRIWPTLILRFGPPTRPTILPCSHFLFSVAPAGAKPSAAAFAARLGEA